MADPIRDAILIRDFNGDKRAYIRELLASTDRLLKLCAPRSRRG